MILTKHIKQILTTTFFTLLGVALMIWIYRGFDFGPLRKVFAIPGNYLWIWFSLLAGVLANILRAFRWRMLLQSAEIPIKRRRAIELVFISYLINSVTPRLGELTRSLLVRRGDMAASAKAFGTVMVEKLSDVACLFCVVVVSVIIYWDETLLLLQQAFSKMELGTSFSFLSIGVGGLLLLLFFLVVLKSKQLRILLHNLWQGATSIAHLEHPLYFVVLCGLIWACNFLQLYLLVPCFVELSNIDIMDAFCLFTAASIGVLLPTPGGAGPWHFAIVKTMTGMFDIPVAVAKLFALVTHGLKTALVILLGLLAYVTFYWEVLTKKLRSI